MRAGCLGANYFEYLQEWNLTASLDNLFQLLNTFKVTTATFAVRPHGQLIVHQDLWGLYCNRQGEQLFYKVQCFLKENHQVVLLDALLLRWFTFLSFTFDFSASCSTLKSLFDVQISFGPKTFLKVPVENSAKWNNPDFYLLWKAPSS